jgi:hypothetical protein
MMFHHLAISFGAQGSCYYLDPRAPLSFWLSLRNEIDDAFFMGLFFWCGRLLHAGAACMRGRPALSRRSPAAAAGPVVIFGIAVAPWLEHVKRSPFAGRVVEAEATKRSRVGSLVPPCGWSQLSAPLL